MRMVEMASTMRVAPVPGDDVRATTDDNLMDITPDLNIVMRIGDGRGVIIVPISNHRQGIDPCAHLFTGVKGRRR